jgi:hypothetical protein
VARLWKKGGFLPNIHNEVGGAVELGLHSPLTEQFFGGLMTVQYWQCLNLDERGFACRLKKR